MTIIIKYLVAALCCVSVCGDIFAQQAHISGTVEAIDKGTVAVWMETPDGVDTICITPVKDERFEAEIFVDEAQMANLSVMGYRGFTTFALTPGGNYSFFLTRDGTATVKSDSPLHAVLHSYQQRVQCYNQKLRDMQREIDVAVAEQKFRTSARLKTQKEVQNREALESLKAVAEENKENVLGIYLLTAPLAEESDPEKLRMLYETFSPQARQTMPAKILANRITILSGLEVNAQAPDFRLPDDSGKTHSLYEQAGELIIVDFWASWCAPCRIENRNMSAIYQSFKERGLRIISISIDTSESEWKKAVESDGLAWLQLIANPNVNAETIRRYNVETVPTVFILNKDKQIIAKNLRHDKLRDFVERELSR